MNAAKLLFFPLKLMASNQEATAVNSFGKKEMKGNAPYIFLCHPSEPSIP